jgi:hypothetical protein
LRRYTKWPRDYAATTVGNTFYKSCARMTDTEMMVIVMRFATGR